MFKDFNNEEEKKSDFICIYLIMLYCTGFRGSRHYAPKVLLDEEEDDFFITVLFQLYYNYKMTIIIILLLVYYVGVFVLFIIYYKRSALTHCGLLSTCDCQ